MEGKKTKRRKIRLDWGWRLWWWYWVYCMITYYFGECSWISCLSSYPLYFPLPPPPGSTVAWIVLLTQGAEHSSLWNWSVPLSYPEGTVKGPTDSWAPVTSRNETPIPPLPSLCHCSSLLLLYLHAGGGWLSSYLQLSAWQVSLLHTWRSDSLTSDAETTCSDNILCYC